MSVMFLNGAVLFHEGQVAFHERCCCEETGCCPDAPEHLKAIVHLESGSCPSNLDGNTQWMDAAAGETNVWRWVEGGDMAPNGDPSCISVAELTCSEVQNPNAPYNLLLSGGLLSFSNPDDAYAVAQCNPFRVEFHNIDVQGTCCDNVDTPAVRIWIEIVEREVP